ncbi:hypothetical protein ACFWY5_23840 [Nonomuraea sp. NPDC059007]|uniref:hypothetical protein n=1 Tax=Nonomuraea sp. NPDC059007 TaxID=3346692 RepID=UPI003687A0F5
MRITEFFAAPSTDEVPRLLNRLLVEAVCPPRLTHQGGARITWCYSFREIRAISVGAASPCQCRGRSWPGRQAVSGGAHFSQV